MIRQQTQVNPNVPVEIDALIDKNVDEIHKVISENDSNGIICFENGPLLPSIVSRRQRTIFHSQIEVVWSNCKAVVGTSPGKSCDRCGSNYTNYNGNKNDSLEKLFDSF